MPLSEKIDFYLNNRQFTETLISGLATIQKCCYAFIFVMTFKTSKDNRPYVLSRIEPENYNVG